jgi:hypothetical protein
MAMPKSGAVPVARSEPRTRTALLLETVALRHQIAVLERSRTRRPCFRLWDRLFLDFVLALVAAMARQPDHRPFRDSLALAPEQLVSALEISIMRSPARWAQVFRAQRN